jgi:hypothetical protein
VNPLVPKTPLMAAFGFDEHDLEVNRSGRITPGQMSWLSQERAATRQTTLGCLGGLLAVSAFYIFIGLMNNGRIPSPSRHIGGSASVNWFVAILAIVVVVVLALIAVSGRRAARDWTEGKAELVEGLIEVSTVDSRKGSFSARINDKTFSISKEAHDAIMALHNSDGAEVIYHVYYAPGNWKILSIEKWIPE